MASLPSKTSAPIKAPAPTELLIPQDYAKAAKVSLSWLAKARTKLNAGQLPGKHATLLSETLGGRGTIPADQP